MLFESKQWSCCKRKESALENVDVFLADQNILKTNVDGGFLIIIFPTILILTF